MKKISVLIFVGMLCSATTFAQPSSTVTILDFVKITDGKDAEALYFYENNWKVYRDIALEKGYIKAYRLLKAKADSASSFNLVLITEYADSAQFRVSEGRFQQIINDVRPNGPKLLNALKPNDFRKNLFYKKAETVFEQTN